MAADTGARRTDVMAHSCTILGNSANTVGIGTIPQTAVRARQLRIIMTVLTVKVIYSGSVVDIRYDIRTAMTAGTLGRPGKII